MPNRSLPFTKETFQGADQATKDGLLYDAITLLVARMGHNCDVCMAREDRCTKQFNELSNKLDKMEANDLSNTERNLKLIEGLSIDVNGTSNHPENGLKERLSKVEKGRAYDKGVSAGLGAVFGFIVSVIKQFILGS